MPATYIEGWFAIEVDHPCLDGHFPGRPVVPGVVLLNEILAIIGPHLAPGLVPMGFDAVKFLRPVAPGARVKVGVLLADTVGKFAGTTDGAPVLSGTARFAFPP